MEHAEIKNRAIRGVIALTGRTILLQVISGAALFLLGIFLDPTAIGVFIVVSSAIRIFNLFTDVGLGAALVQKREDLEKDDLPTAFAIQEVLVIAVITAGFFLTGFVSSKAHFNADGVFLYHVLLVILFISSLKVIPSILMERKLAFEKQILPQIIEALIFNVLVVILAYRGYGVASYSWSFLISALAGLPVYYLLAPWKISLRFSFARARRLFSFGLQYQGKSFLAVIKDDLLTFFMSSIVGPTGIGYWGVAQRWALYPYRFLVDSITKVTFPAYSRVQDNPGALKSGIERSLFLISLVVFPIYTLMLTLVEQLIRYIPRYGKWEPAILSFYFLCGSSVITALTNVLVNLLDATGRVRTTLMLMVLWIILIWSTTFVFVARIGFTGIALSQFVVSAGTIWLVAYWVKRIVPINFLDQVIVPLAAALPMGIATLIILSRLPKSFVSVVLAAAGGSIIYVLLVLLFSRKKVLDNAKVILEAYRLR